MITISIQYNSRQMDIQVNDEQRIEDTLHILTENKYLPALVDVENVKIRSDRNRRYINGRLTYKQAEIYNGDRLTIKE